MVYLNREVYGGKTSCCRIGNITFGTISKNLLKIEYEKIEQQGIEFVKVKHLQKKIFEIKSNELRSLFKYKEGKIIVIGVVFVKKTQKTPKETIKLAEKRLKEV
ncbi:type II toxin-antitoxin system RelE/ParE family toxin [Treponema vincentii]|uniref:type II toxin-antitoxin system RelE/ParE family toxin n=1 Tax=Treponema vincentii TaxID=69710 RepID=UPI0020A4FFCE|nr:type II toxin-antitoxin system RelE/ParE family toxin [Treponema vincentii]UTC49307.1 hypothetical protein E4N73_10965 [Treponema vincentii]